MEAESVGVVDFEMECPWWLASDVGFGAVEIGGFAWEGEMECPWWLASDVGFGAAVIGGFAWEDGWAADPP